MRKILLFLALLMLLVSDGSSQAAPAEKVVWQARLEPADARAGESAQIVVTAKIAPGWHLYSLTQPPGGSLATTLELVPGHALKSAGNAVQPLPVKKRNPVFKITDELYENAVVFGIPVKIAANTTGAQKAQARVRFMVCTDKTCLPPAEKSIPIAFAVAPGAARAERMAALTAVPKQPPGAVNGETTTPSAEPENSPTSIDNQADGNRIQRAQNSGLLSFLGLALGAGFLALLTPCVFPMIPITVSFFTKRQEQSGGRGVAGPTAFCLGIIGTFTAIGLLVSLLLKVFAINFNISQFAANPWLNLAFAAIFVLLALNLFGVFEIMVPPALMDRVQPKTAMAGGDKKPSLWVPVLMGLAFSLTSFTCTVPFVGTLLATTARSGALWPTLGMMVFGAAFASPFFLLALFPQWLAKLPKSGGWLVSVKAFMGFLELAAALKFLSSADFVWQLKLLTRPIFLSLWSTIFLVAGFYLLRWLRLPHDDSTAKPGPLRRILGAATVALGIYLLTATGSVSLGDFDAYLPPRAYGQPAGAVPQRVAWIVDDYAGARAKARQENKPLLLNFTGYACTNCRLMEENVLPRPEVTSVLEDFVAVELHTDGVDEKSKANAKLQREQFGTVTLPLYVVLSPQGKELARFEEGFTRDPLRFVAFLKRGGERLEKK